MFGFVLDSSNNSIGISVVDIIVNSSICICGGFCFVRVRGCCCFVSSVVRVVVLECCMSSSSWDFRLLLWRISFSRCCCSWFCSWRDLSLVM